MLARRVLLVAALLVPLGATALPAHAAVPACEVPSFIAGTTLVAGNPGEALKVRFHVDRPLAAGEFLWAEVALHWATTAPAGVGFAAERAMVATFLETSDGASIENGGLSMYPYGVQLDSNAATVRLDAQDGGGCGGAAAGSQPALAAGTDYVVVVLGASDTNGAAGVALPSHFSVVSVERSTSHRLSESDMTCEAKLRLAAIGLASEALVGCQAAVAASDVAYRAVFVDHFPDAAHQARFIDPNGQAGPNVVFSEFGRGASGTWTLDVPKYVTPLGNPFYVPVGLPYVGGSEAGIIGAIADLA